MDQIFANALMVVHVLEHFGNILGFRMPWAPRALSEQQRAEIQTSLARCEHISHGIMERAGFPWMLKDTAIGVLNNVRENLEHMENEEQYLEINHILQAELNYWEAKMLERNENWQFFNNDLEIHEERFLNVVPVRRRRDARRG